MPVRVALIPVSPLDRAKRRLSGLLSVAARAELIAATLRTVVEAASGAGLAPVVLTDDPRAAVAAGPLARVLEEVPGHAGSGLSGQVAAALPRLDGLLGELPELVAVLHADLPLASAAAIEALLSAVPPAPSVTLVRSADGGTTALVLAGELPLRAFRFVYGPGSAAAHIAASRSLGLEPAIADIPELALDLDTPADLDMFMGLPAASHTPAAAVLARHLSAADRRGT